MRKGHDGQGGEPKAGPRASSPPIDLATVHSCDTTEDADRLLGDPSQGYVYQRDGHVNGDRLAQQCAVLHGAANAVITANGMSALAAIMIAKLQTGDHVVVGEQAYGKSIALFTREAERLGIRTTTVDSMNLELLTNAVNDRTKLIVVETIANPRLRVCNINAIASVAHANQAKLVVDNTFATPIICRPLELGADIVMESMTKLMNGHGDLMLGMIAGPEDAWDRISDVVTTWGFRAAPFDCWLAERSLRTLALRVEQSANSAQVVAEYLCSHPVVENVDYPGLAHHPDHELARQQFETASLRRAEDRQSHSDGKLFGNMVTFQLAEKPGIVNRLIETMNSIPFFPSLGDTSTSISHPVSTSHRSIAPDVRESMGISEGTVRLSVGLEPADWIIDRLRLGLDGLDD